MAEEMTNIQTNSEAASGTGTGTEAPPASSEALTPAASLLGESGNETKAEAPQTEQPGKPEQEGKEAEVIPTKAEDYKIEFAPETQVDTELLKWFQGWAFERKMPLSEAAAMAKQYEGMVKSRSQELEQKQSVQLKEQEAAWREQSMKSLGANRDEGMAAINRFMKEFAGEADHPLRKLFDSTGLGSHPEMVKLAASVGKRLGEPAFVRSNSSAPAKTLAEALYPNQGKV
jgi:hypothetical protein